MTSQLTLYNKALVEFLGERNLTALTDDVPSRYYLDGVWNSGKIIDKVLAENFWKFATRVTKIDYDTTIEPEFGYRYAFSQPNDMVQPSSIAVDEFHAVPLTAFKDSNNYWFCDYQTIYVDYISNDASYGGDLSKWTPSVEEWVACYMAKRVCRRITQSKTMYEELTAEENKLRVEAGNKDAIRGGTKFAPMGRWSTSRTSGSFGRRAERDY